MKKYEKPMVELTKFNAEDIIATSGDKRVEAMNHSQVSRHKKAQFFRGSGYFVCSQYKASASLGVSILSVPCGLFVL